MKEGIGGYKISLSIQNAKLKTTGQTKPTPPGLITPPNVSRLVLLPGRLHACPARFNPHSNVLQRLSSTGLYPECWRGLCKPARACLSFSTPYAILFVRRQAESLRGIRP